MTADEAFADFIDRCLQQFQRSSWFREKLERERPRNRRQRPGVRRAGS